MQWKAKHGEEERGRLEGVPGDTLTIEIFTHLSRGSSPRGTQRYSGMAPHTKSKDGNIMPCLHALAEVRFAPLGCWSMLDLTHC